MALNLERFYGQVRSGLVEAQCKQSVALLEQQVSHFLLVHQAWCEVERANAGPAAVSEAPQQPPAESAPRSSADWNG